MYRFINFKRALNWGYKLLAYLGSYDSFFWLSDVGGALKLTKSKHIFTSPGNTKFQK